MNSPRPEYIGNGAFGCIFRPSVSCSAAMGTGLDRVSKVFHHKEEAIIERDITTRLIEKIDPYHLFTVNVLEECPVQKEQLPPDELAKCDKYSERQRWKESKELYQLVYPYAGVNLIEFAKAPTMSTIHLFYCIFHVVCGLYHMQQIDILHCDIKADNLMIHPDTKSVRLIDFGLAQAGSHLYDHFNPEYAEYIFSPPEYLMFKVFSEVKPGTDASIPWSTIADNQLRLFSMLEYRVKMSFETWNVATTKIKHPFNDPANLASPTTAPLTNTSPIDKQNTQHTQHTQNTQQGGRFGFSALKQLYERVPRIQESQRIKDCIDYTSKSYALQVLRGASSFLKLCNIDSHIDVDTLMIKFEAPDDLVARLDRGCSKLHTLFNTDLYSLGISHIEVMLATVHYDIIHRAIPFDDRQQLLLYKLFDWIACCTDPNPFTRYTPVKAYAAHVKWIKLLRQLYP
jgi:serine/threonine protein kinase